LQPPSILSEGLSDALRRATVRDAEIRYLRIGTGKPVVLLHTLRTQLEYFRGLLERIDLDRFEAIAVDLPGHGRSSAPRADYTADFFSDAVEQLLEQLEVREATIVGDSIGAAIALILAARGNTRVTRVVAINPYDYGRRGGIRRSSPLANVVFTTMIWPGIGTVVARTEAPPILRGVLRGGLYDPSVLPDDLVGELSRCGRLPGHARAHRSLHRHWRSWLEARERYDRIDVPVALAYSDHDWSRPDEREANARAIPSATVTSLPQCGHFASLERPELVAELLHG
jgi:pimeloyl-ACP methyl ester carboxylesterase